MSEYEVPSNVGTQEKDVTVMDWLTALNETPIIEDFPGDGWVHDWAPSLDAETELLKKQLENEAGTSWPTDQETNIAQYLPEMNEIGGLSHEAVPDGYEIEEEYDPSGLDIRPM
ncbi:hypothetical protein F5Y12DRAFT_718536 [Xylaria sp. FL1777]|nr:hypothetical protein F5Y12DRAFT_718536 [Xylaria sp. FL1777]